MFPFCFEWSWGIGHVVFMGIFWLVAAIIVIGLTYCFIKSAVDTMKQDKISEGGTGAHP